MRSPWTLAICCLACGLLDTLPATHLLAAPSLEWHELYDGGMQQVDDATAALTDTAGNLIVAGSSVGMPGSVDILVRKLDRATGAPIWTHRQLGTAENDMAVGGMVWDGDGNLLIGGTRLGCFG